MTNQNILHPVSLTDYVSNFPDFAAKLGQSFQRYGFAVVSNHGLPGDLIEEFLTAYKHFFALPEKQKTAYHIADGGGQRGYTPFGIETAKGHHHYDLKEFWHIGRPLPAGHPFEKVMPENIWPTEIPGLKNLSLRMFEAFDQFGLKLLEAIAVYLHQPRDFFSTRVDHGNSILRILHYPPVIGEVPNTRAGAHEDINVITLLLGAEEAGLQILDRDGSWLPITPPPGCIVINIGDMLQRMTNHVLPSTRHRVVNPSPERARFARYSMPYFLHFNPDVDIRTLPETVTADNPDRYPEPIMANDFLQQRLREIKLI